MWFWRMLRKYIEQIQREGGGRHGRSHLGLSQVFGIIAQSAGDERFSVGEQHPKELYALDKLI